MFSRLPLRYALPLWIILLTFCFSIGEVFYTLNTRENIIQANLQTTMQSDGNRLSAQIEQILRKEKDTLVQRQEIKRLFSLYLTGSTTDFILLDDQGRKIESESIHHDLNNNIADKMDELIQKVSKTGTNMVISNKKHDHIKGFFPVRMAPKEGELVFKGYGTLIIAVTYTAALEKEYVSAYQSLLLRFSIILIVVVAIIIFLRRRVINRVALMSDTIHRIANGDSTARMDVAIDDELGEIARSFNDMVDRLKKKKEELEEYKNELEHQVALEISKRREQEGIMMQQSRLAGMGEMIGNIAHQWRQPLNALGLVVMNIKDAYDYEELTSDFLEKSTDKAFGLIQKMSTTIDDFRNFFKPDKEKGRFGLAEMVNEAYALVDVAFALQSIHVDIRIDPSLEVTGYKNEFSQVILNLLNNARDVLEERQIQEKEIEIHAQKRGEEIVLSVRDNGGGVPKEVLPRIFDPYFSTKEEGKGTGIGLYMSKTIIEEHHKGRLSVYNDAKGAVFTITLPKL